MRANVAHWDVADGTFEHQKFLELFVDLLFLIGDRIQPNFHPSEGIKCIGLNVKAP